MAKVTPKEGGGGQGDNWTPYVPGQGAGPGPYTPGVYGGGLLGPSTDTSTPAPTGWKPPIVQQFTYPPGLLAQIAQSQQQPPGGQQFNRWNFGTPQGQQPYGIQNTRPQYLGGQSNQMGGLLGQIMQMMQRGYRG